MQLRWFRGNNFFLPLGIFSLPDSNILWYFFQHVNKHNRNMQSIFKKILWLPHIDYLVRERSFELPLPHMLE